MPDKAPSPNFPPSRSMSELNQFGDETQRFEQEEEEEDIPKEAYQKQKQKKNLLKLPFVF